jgi:glycosyltransferase involved in cell wall biosynthesis
MTTLTVALPTYNPRRDFLDRVLASLRAQTVPPSQWDFVLVDNNSSPPLEGTVDLSWHPRGRVLLETTQGKMHAIAAAFRQTRTDLVMFLDDDTVAAPDLIEQTLRLGDQHAMLGTWSPRVELDLEDTSVVVPPRLRQLLSERLVETAMWSNDPDHTPSTPWGGGMCVRRAVADAYLAQTAANPRRLQLDPMGDQPGYGGDTDLSYTGCSIGLGMGVFPQLKITHLIPARRCSIEYLLRNLEAHEFSHWMQHHARTGEWPAVGGVRARAARGLRWLRADALERQMMAAESRGRASAQQAIATNRDRRPVTHR